MSLFHRHHWIVTSKTFNGPMLGKMKSEGCYPEDFLERLLFGFTIITLRCLECGDLSFKRTNGKAELS
jgi:hypothetical protein